ncbi:MAG: hypothetical protein Q9181_005653 [Wetmoreana brouardii]
MKRKLDEANVPTPAISSTTIQTESGFVSIGLDTRLEQAILKEGFSAPTAVQSKNKSGQISPVALILLPTNELAQQTSKAITAFSAFCHKEIRTVDLTQKVPGSVQRSLLAASPDIVVATPSRAAVQISTSTLSIDNLSILAIDEADLVLSYGYEEDLHNFAKSLPSTVQTMLMSATLTTEIETLKALYCRNPVVVEVEDRSGDDGGVTQYVVKCAEDEKFLLAFVIFKLKLIKGKCIIFVADTDRCYRLKLFLEQFGVKGCILNSELPVNSRCHVVEEFNKNVYDIILASDENEVLGNEEKTGHPRDNQAMPPERRHDGGDRGGTTTAKVKRRKSTNDSKEYGIARGIDFKNVACVLNFDLPMTSRSYTHRIGRTARAGRTGMALSFVVPSSQYMKHRPTSTPSAEHDEDVLAKIIRHQGKKGKEVKPYSFDMKQVDAFRYRVNDALRAVTQITVREARTRELRQEILTSEKLKRHFEENPEDLQHLRHDGELRAARVQPHLKHIPDYLMPTGGKRAMASGDIGFVGFGGTSENRIRKVRIQKRMSGKGKKSRSRKPDPLKTFNAKGKR